MIINKYPYTDFHELNQDWILEQINMFNAKVDNIEQNILDQAKQYTDEAIASSQQALVDEFNQFKQQVTSLMAGLDEEYTERYNKLNAEWVLFRNQINAQMMLLDNKVTEMGKRVDSAVAVANAYTNQAIYNNNEYIIDEVSKGLGAITVVNYFTGERISVQAMFDYLAQFHLTNAINYLQMATREKTYNEFVAMNMTYTQLAVDGATLYN